VTLGKSIQLLVQCFCEGIGRCSRPRENGAGKPTLLREKRAQQVFDIDLLVAIADGQRLRGLEGLLHCFYETVRIHASPLTIGGGLQAC
jgi:hypothetical protein